ncbi:MAG: zinc ABC transporter substrate-binding protein, partial [Thermomicrobiaceae bacterium]|nr:zinc ABC transporter substrate-binding protein [Thermomicrobiaceae bacterium]
FYPRPSTVKAVADADVVFVNGLGLETWLGPLIESAGGSKVPVYALAEGLPTLEAPSEETGGRLEANPHLWLDPTNAERYVERMARALSERDPSGAATYQANARRAEEAIAALDREAQAAIATIPESRRTLVTFHDAYPYFAAHYGLRLVGVVVKSPGREPSSRELTDLVTTIRAQGVSAIFVEPQFNPKLADTLAREAGIRTLTLYSDTPPPGQGYLEMMRLNVQHVVEGLR